MNAAMLFKGIRDANYHCGGIRCLRLFKLDETYFDPLKSEVMRLVATEDSSRVNDVHHVTNWTRPRGEVRQFSLFNASGRYDDFSADHNFSSTGKDFRGYVAYPALARLISELPHLVNFRISVLSASARLSAHEEHSVVFTETGAVAARVRFHLPITSNSQAELMLDGDVYHLEPGAIYFVNHGCVHAASNSSSTARIHLVWDMLLTRLTFKFMFDDAACLLPLTRVVEDDQIPCPTRTERVGSYLRIPEQVSIDRAGALSWWEFVS